jgi:hypothetical protein
LGDVEKAANEKYFYLEDLKSHLMVPFTHGKSFIDSKFVFTKYLNNLRGKIMERLKEDMDDVNPHEDVRWVFTIPNKYTEKEIATYCSYIAEVRKTFRT